LMGVLAFIQRLGRFLKPSPSYNLNLLVDMLLNLVSVDAVSPRAMLARRHKLMNLRSLIAELGVANLLSLNSSPNYEDFRYVMLLYESDSGD